ncbi:MAG: hypothetical protein U0350_24765 [Caldilineaceae bacterium]
MDFPNNQLHALWTVRVVEVNTKTEILSRIVAQRVIDISAQCSRVDALPIINQRAQFDSAGYITCNTPSFRDELATLLPGYPRLEPNCECSEAYATVDGRWEAGDAATSVYPLFIHPDFKFTSSLNGAQVKSNLWLNEQVYTSPTWSLNPTGNQVWSGVTPFLFAQVAGLFRKGIPVGASYTGWAAFLNTPAFISTTAQQRPGLFHWYERGSLAASPDKPLHHMDTGSLKVYIGYDPATDSHFHGEIRLLDVDPCPGPKHQS